MSTVADAPRQSASVRLRHRTAFWVVAFALLVMLAFSAVPTPLYPAYQARDGFSSFMITVIFATYPVGVVISLFTVGHLSDWHGRRRLVLPALGGAIVSALVFIFWRDVPGLLLARFVGGLAVGAVTASATAWIAELHAQARPGAPPRFAEVVATAANLGGIGCGPLISGMLVAWVADPFVVPFLLFIAALLVAAALLTISPETREPVRPRPAWRPQRISVPADARGAYFAAAVTAAMSFASFALFTSLAPSFLADTLGHTSPALAGATAFIVFASGAAGQMFVAGRPIPVGLAIGTGLMLSGLAIVVLAVWLPDPSLALFLIGGALAGAGSGCLFKAVLTQAARMAPPERRAETLAGMFLAGYVGLALPVVGLGVLTQYASAKVGLLVFGAVLAAAALAAMPAVLRGARRFA
ncbi:MAG TPA: MFS transporter [Solirubrobacterales bacterium]